MKRASGKFLRNGFLCLITLASIAALTLIGEASPPRTPKIANYLEKNGSPYDPTITTERLVEPWLWVYAKSSRFEVRKTEFTQVHSTNSEGLSGALLPLEKKRGELRIIAVGDSFTEGIGDPG